MRHHRTGTPFGPVNDKQRRHLERIGRTRRAVYALAVGAGLRRAELGGVRRCDFEDSEASRIHLPAWLNKSERDQWVPLLEETVAVLRKYLADYPGAPSAPLFPSRFFPRKKTFDADLRAAGIPKHDARGRVVDLHALRTTFITWLAVSGVHPKAAQLLARHSSIELTMRYYTDESAIDLRGAIEKVAPALRQAADRRHQAEPDDRPQPRPQQSSVPNTDSTALTSLAAHQHREPSRNSHDSAKHVSEGGYTLERVKGIEPSTLSLGS
ncbi:tyrosine-type recombinase/integrase [Planctomycetota bacterium]